MAHLYKRRNQFWICYYVNGQRTQKSLQTDNERIAREKKRRIEYELSLGNLQQASKLPLAVVLEDFCKYLKNARTRKSYKNDISRLRIFFGPICDSLKLGSPGVKRAEACSKAAPDRYAGLHVKAQLLEDITPDVINRFLAQRAKLNCWAPKTRNLMRETLHRLFAFAIKHHRFRSRDVRYPNPAAGVDRLRNPAPKIRFLSLDEIDIQLDAVKCQPVIWALTATYIYAGVRREEALWLTHDDIDMSARLMRVRAKAIGEEEWQPKTKRNRCIPISSRLLEIYTQHRPKSNCVWFFPSPTGKRWDPDNFSQDLRKINKVHGLKWSCLDFRHTFGSHLAQKGESLYKIAELMGNSPEICRRHYAALMPERMQDTVEFETEAGAVGDRQRMVESMFKEIPEKLDDRSNPEPALRLRRSM